MDRDDPTSLMPMTREEIVHHVTIALKVLRPPVQFGRGRRLPHESDRDCRAAAERLAEHFEMSNIRIFKRPPLPAHGGGFGRIE